MLLNLLLATWTPNPCVLELDTNTCERVRPYPLILCSQTIEKQTVFGQERPLW